MLCIQKGRVRKHRGLERRLCIGLSLRLHAKHMALPMGALTQPIYPDPRGESASLMLSWASLGA